MIPTKIVEDKLWLWPDSSPEGVKVKAQTPQDGTRSVPESFTLCWRQKKKIKRGVGILRSRCSKAAHREWRFCATNQPANKRKNSLVFLSRPAKESERVQPVTVPDLDLGEGEFGGNWHARDLAYGADSLIQTLAGEIIDGVDA